MWAGSDGVRAHCFFAVQMFPICSMYGILSYIWVIFRANVGKYSIHGASMVLLWLWKEHEITIHLRMSMPVSLPEESVNKPDEPVFWCPVFGYSNRQCIFFSMLLSTQNELTRICNGWTMLDSLYIYIQTMYNDEEFFRSVGTSFLSCGLHPTTVNQWMGH